MDSMERLIDYTLKLGASYAGVMYHEVDSSVITIENGVLKSYTTGKTSGIGVRVIVKDAFGIASSTTLNPENLRKRVKYAINMTKAAASATARTQLSDVKIIKTSSVSKSIKPPSTVSNQEKITTAIDANKSAMIEGVQNSITRLAWLSERRVFKSSEGADVTNELTITGLSQSCVSSFQGNMEFISDSRSKCAGFEFISEMDWCRFSRDVAETSLNVVRARIPKAGFYKVVADPDLIGLILHEAFGHASEADLITTGESILDGRLGEKVASPLVTIIDDGTVEGGYFLPYDDEGVVKNRQIVVEGGILKGLLHSRETAYKMGTISTGNARTEDFGSRPIVRQTNLFMKAGSQSFEELIEGVNNGLYICGRGARGGQVNVGLGTFTFRAGPSYVIEKGEIKEMVRGVSLRGTILETLTEVDAVGKDILVRTSIFGGCGKDGQRARVGSGGPHVRIGRMAVGGGA